MLTPDELRELEEVERKMTPGWRFGVRRDKSIWISLGNPLKCDHYQFDWLGSEKNAEICTLRNSFRSLLDHIAEQERRIAELEGK